MEMKALSFVVLGAIGRRSTYPYSYRSAAHFSCETSKLLQDDGYAFETASHVVDHFLLPATTTNEYPPLLRRVLDNTINIDDNPVTADWINQLFAPIYGMSGNAIRPNNSVSILPNYRSTRRSSNSKKQRTNLKITLAYRGKDFCGWEDQRHDLYRSAKDDGNGMNSSIDQAIPALPSVQGTLADALHPLLAMNNDANIITDPILHDDGLDESSLSKDSAATTVLRQHRKHNTHSTRPIEIKVAGRTDAGVSAIGQVCRIRTWNDIFVNGEIEKHVQQLVNEHIAPNINGRKNSLGLRIQSVECVGDEFHPTFGATSRAYVYLLDLPMHEYNDNEHNHNSSQGILSSSLSVPRMNALLQTLVNRELDYIAMSYGKVKSQTTLCTLFHARASIVELVGCSDGVEYDGGSLSLLSKTSRRAICIELVGNRFLRRMVRILVATVIREASSSSYVDDVALLNIIFARDRNLAARPAPPDGLLFVGAEFTISPT